MLRAVGTEPLAIATQSVFQTPLRPGPPSDWTGHIPFAFWLIQMQRPDVFVEIGTRAGVGYSAFAQGVLVAGLSTECYSVCPEPEETPADWPAFHDAHFGAFSRRLCLSAEAAAERFADQSVDLLHLECRWRHDTMMAVLDVWRPKLSPRALIVLHGVCAMDDPCDAGTVWPQLRHAHPSFTFTHSGGLGIAAAGPTLQEGVAWLLGLQDDSPQAVTVRRFFAALGELQVVQVALREETRRRQALESATPALKDQVTAAHEALDGLRQRVSELQQALADRDARLAEQGARACAAEEEARASQGRLGDLQIIVDGFVQQVRDLREALVEHRVDVASLSRHVETERARSTRLRAQLVAARADRGRLLRALRQASGDLDAVGQGRLALERAGLPATPPRPPNPWDVRRTGVRGLRDNVRWSRRLLRRILRAPEHRARLRRLLRDREARRAALAAAHAVLASGWFDDRHYASSAGIEAPSFWLAWHYELCGRHAGLDPHPLFDTDYYLDANSDVREAGVNPVLHYTVTGCREHRSPHPLFDALYYRKMYPEVAVATDDLCRHYLQYGWREGRDPHAYFDTSYYLRRYPDVARAGQNPLLHFVEHGAAERRDPCPHFSTGFYLDAYPDVARAGINPLVHYMTFGLAEQRLPAPQPPRPPSGVGLRSRPTFAVYVSSVGNYFFQEIASVLVAGLQDLGLPTTRRSERDGVGPETFHVALAPHELFTLGAGHALRHLLPRDRTIVCNTEQPKSRWFGPVRGLLGRTAAIWDIDYSSSRLIQAEGYDCHYVPLGYSPELAIFNEAIELPVHYGTASLPPEWFPARAARRPWRERPIDVLFVGHLSERRNAIMGAIAPVLAGLRCMLHFSDVSKPVLPGVTSFMDTRTVVGLAQRAKVILNLHHGHGVYFEWQRMVMQGMWQGTLVLTEPAAFAPPLEPGRHFIVAPVKDLGTRLTELLTTDTGRARAERVAAQGFEAATAGCRAADYLAAALQPLLRDARLRR